MPIVTSLKPQRDGKRVNVYMDGDFAFGIDLDNLVKFGIKIEKEFSKEEIDKIVYEAEFHKTFSKLLNFATLRPRSEKEINDWLLRKLKKSLSEKFFLKQSLRLRHRLNKLELIDDVKFAKWWVGQRLEFKQKSKREMQFELKQKGINQQIIKDVFADSDIDEELLAKKQFEKNKYKWKKFDEKTQKEKASAFLARKGFNWETIKSVVKYAEGE